jgi:hypothetical protein
MENYVMSGGEDLGLGLMCSSFRDEMVKYTYCDDCGGAVQVDEGYNDGLISPGFNPWSV